MGKKALFTLSAFMICVVFLVAAHSQEDMKFVIVDVFENPQRPAAIFRHDEHNETAEIEECNECHHVYDENGKLLEFESSEEQLCCECHELQQSGRKPALMQAFHTNCKGCHQKNKIGPIMCGQCHVKRPDVEV
jgi:hypothetical protein